MFWAPTDDYLAHHGIDGQKWGQRNGPPYPLDPEKDYSKEEKKAADIQQKAINKVVNKGIRDQHFRNEHIIPKGTSIYRVTDSPVDSSEQKYISYLDADRNHYKGGWIRNQGKTGEAYEHKYTLVEDVKVPSRKELTQVINDVVRSDSKTIKETIIKWESMAIPKYLREQMYQDLKTGEYSDKLYRDHINETIKEFSTWSPERAYYYCAQSFGTNKGLKDKVISELSKRGYNAMVDEASVGGQNEWRREGVDPLILFDNSMLKSESVKKITNREENKAHLDDIAWQKKANKNSAQWSDSDITFIKHHGILGQKWGKRNGPPYPLDFNDHSAAEKRNMIKGAYVNETSNISKINRNKNIIIDKGQKMYRVSSNKEDNSNVRYVSFRDKDRNFYKGYWSGYLKEVGGTNKTYEQEYELNSSLIIPSLKKRQKILSSLLDDSEVIKSLYKEDYTKDKDTFFRNQMKNKSETERAEYISKFLGERPDILEKYGKAIVEQGFNAVIDDNGTKYGEMPLILFSANDQLLRRGSIAIDELAASYSRSIYNVSN